MKRRTRTYRRDIPPKGIYYAQTDTNSWQEALKTLEKVRSKLPRMFEKESLWHFTYDLARNILEEVGSVEGTPAARDAQYLPPDQRRRAAQEVLTRLSKILDPKDQTPPQQGQSKPNKDESAKSENKPNTGNDQDDEDDEEEEEDFSESGGEDEDEEKEEEQYNPGGTGGGGRQYHGESKDQSIFYATRFLIRKLAEHDDRTNRQVFGHDTWNAQKVLAAHYKPNELPTAKEGWGKQVDDVYLTLDTSGSVSALADVIAGVAAGSAGIVHLFSGGEANPYYYVDRKTPLSHPQEPFPEWDSQKDLFAWTGDRMDLNRFAQGFVNEYLPFYPYLTTGCFETLVAWLIKTQKPKKGSRLLFWGDTEGTGIVAPKLLKQLVTNYRMAWLYSEDFWLLHDWQKEGKLDDHLKQCVAHPYNYGTYEYPKLMAVGIPVIPEVTNPESFRRALKVLQTQK